MAGLDNPYTVGEPIRAAHQFFGRQEVIAQLLATLAAAPTSQTMILYGAPRMGKTSLLYQLIPQLADVSLYPIYFDVKAHSQQTPDEQLYALAETIAPVSKLPPLPREQLRENPLILTRLLSHVSFLLGETRLLLVIDEFDYIPSRDEGGPGSPMSLLPMLRQWHSLPLNMLLTSARPPAELPDEWQQDSILLRLTTLSREEADELVVKTAGDSVIYAPDALDELWALTSGHPYMLQMLCFVVFDAAKKRGQRAIIARDIETTAQELVRSRSLQMTWIGEGLPAAERAVLSAVAHLSAESKNTTITNGAVTLDMISRLLPRYRMGQVVELQSLVHRLVERDFLQLSEGQYRFTARLVEQWFLAQYPLRRMEKAAPAAPAASPVKRMPAEEMQAMQYLQSARRLRKENQWEKAIADYERAYILAPKRALQQLVEARLAWGIQLEKNDNERAAAVEYSRILEIAPSMTKVRQHLSNVMLRWARRREETGDWSQALSLYQRASSLSPDAQLSQYIKQLRGLRQTKSNPAGFYNWIVQAYREGEWKRVIELARQFTKQFGELPQIVEIRQTAELRRTMKRIAAGPFPMGTDARELQRMIKRYAWERDLVMAEAPQREVYVEEFYIGRYPVTNVQYYEFVQETQHRPPITWGKRIYPADKANHPVTAVSWYDAQAYAEWAGKRLPTEAEWEKAARGGDGRMWAWGNEFDKTRCNTVEGGARGTTAVGKYSPGGNSPYGVTDVAGNVWEWTLDFYKGYEGHEEAAPYYRGWRDRYGEKFRVLRGGSWAHYSLQARCAFRAAHPPDATNETIGFRCVLGPAPEIPDELDL